MNDFRDVPLLVVILAVGAIVILIAVTVAAYLTIGRDEREAKRRATATVHAWWMAGGDVDSRPAVLQLDDDAGDGDDEGLVRVPPDVLLRQTFDADVRAEA